MGIINYIEFGGVKSSDYGIYVSGEGTFNAPERDVELIEIPGRNGDFSLDKGRFKNITVTYPVFNYETNLADFRTRLSDFRNALKSKIGYQRLEDTFHPDEFRMATFVDVIDVKPVMYNTASTIELTFNCKPQRFLKSGEEPQTIGQWGETQTASGSIATFEAESNTGIKSLVANIEPVQSGSGDPSPTNVRPISGWDSVKVNHSGKNLLDTSNMSTAEQNGVKFSRSTDGIITVGGNANANTFRIVGSIQTVSGVQYICNGCPSGGASGKYRMTIVGYGYDYGNGYTFTGDGNSHNISIDVYTGYPSSGTLVFKPMIRLATETDPTYEPYQGETITKSLGRTVYGGTLDLVSGVLTVTHKIITFTNGDGWQWNANRGIVRRWLSDIHNAGNTVDQYKLLVECDRLKSGSWAGGTSFTNYDYSCSAYFGDSIAIYIRGLTTLDEYKAWITQNTPTFRYLLATPQTYQLTPEQIQTLLGVNNIWADSGEVSVEYGADPNDVYNPTPFSAKPLVEAEGHGLISINGQNVNILPAKPLGYIPLWVGTRPPENIGESIYLDFSKFNTGDKFYLSAIYSVNYYALEYLRTTQGTGTSSNADFIVNNATISFEDDILRFDVLTPEDIEFTIGTEKTVATTFTINTTNPALTINIPFSIHYIPSQNVITLGADTEEATSGVSGSVEGYSSVVIDAKTYIDCEIGEAYYLEDGEVISANNSVSLPAILPELKAGNNPITHDDTITELKITPRWWKI